MYNSSKLLLLLLNIFFNLGIMNPALHETPSSVSQTMLQALSINSPFKQDAQAKMDQIMEDYANKLIEIYMIKDDTQAIEAMQKARKVFLERAKLITLELEAQLGKMSPEEANRFKEKQMLKPYFKKINDARMAYTLSGKLEKDARLKNAFLDIDVFIHLLYKQA